MKCLMCTFPFRLTLPGTHESFLLETNKDLFSIKMRKGFEFTENLDDILKTSELLHRNILLWNHDVQASLESSQMEFRFNFGEADENSLEDSGDNIRGTKSFRICIQHSFTVLGDKNAENMCIKSFDVAGRTLRYLDPDQVSKKLQNDENLDYLRVSDLKSGEYEGGLKIWECTFDLLTYLQTNSLYIQQKRVLDLGCGAGMLGVYSCLEGAEHVCFQDYNSEVIENYTIPCVRLNDHDERLSNCTTFLSGDWDQMSVHLTKPNSQLFDLILSSETIYNVEYYPKLLNVLETLLSPHGVAFFAAKTHYFGVGGGTMDFSDYLTKNGRFNLDVVLKFEAGLSREILKIAKN